MADLVLPDWLVFRPRLFPSSNFAWLAGPRPVLVDSGFGSDLDATLGLVPDEPAPASTRIGTPTMWAATRDGLPRLPARLRLRTHDPWRVRPLGGASIPAGSALGPRLRPAGSATA
ncbi:MAG TPA: hypothetical protein VHK65_17270 [Candidatus Dormibacteraeota bacterium]|nr:hypothetical protein [Candidatus Dormibacteraeota bacterium]